MSDQDDVLLANILREIGATHDQVESKTQQGLEIFSQILKMPSLGFKRLGLDTAVTAGSFGDWESSFLISQRLLREGDFSPATKLWHVKSLLELERFSEALAFSKPVDWPSHLKIHADFLTAQCYKNLGMKKQALTYLKSVKKADPDYPGLIELNLQ